ncbi:MAG: hypothetical protein JW795_03550 [Chitinivibrionales bacterium]|nr:hypothetical protein [Chitinivibrionales bacterium]
MNRQNGIKNRTQTTKRCRTVITPSGETLRNTDALAIVRTSEKSFQSA